MVKRALPIRKRPPDATTPGRIQGASSILSPQGFSEPRPDVARRLLLASSATIATLAAGWRALTASTTLPEANATTARRRRHGARDALGGDPLLVRIGSMALDGRKDVLCPPFPAKSPFEAVRVWQG
jgi:hypothetical protein